MKPNIVAACNITQPGDPRGKIYVESLIKNGGTEKCTEAKTKCTKRNGNTRQTNETMAENDYEGDIEGVNEEDNEGTGTMDNCPSVTNDIIELKSVRKSL